MPGTAPARIASTAGERTPATATGFFFTGRKQAKATHQKKSADGKGGNAQMTKKEIAHINAKIEQYRKWAAEEAAEARRAADDGERDEHRLQERLNDSAADTLELLLSELL